MNQAYQDVDGFKKPLFIYRGMADCTWKLLPSVFRTFTSKDGTSPDFKKYIDEYDMYMHFIKEAKAFIKELGNDRHQDFLDWIVYAQHFGVPTRLLDFTSNPLVALFFACSGNFDSDAVVWIININNYRNAFAENYTGNKETTREQLLYGILDYVQRESDTCCEYPIDYIPYYLDERMSAQASYFFLWGKKDISLEEMFGQDNYMETSISSGNMGISVDYEGKRKEFLFKIHIPKEEKRNILYQLDSIGVQSKMIFPGLDGLGKYIAFHHDCTNQRFVIKH